MEDWKWIVKNVKRIVVSNLELAFNEAQKAHDGECMLRVLNAIAAFNADPMQGSIFNNEVEIDYESLLGTYKCS